MEFYVYVKLKPYVRQWLMHKFGEGEWKVKFPTQSRENAFLRARLLVCPEGAIPQRREGDEVGILIPSSQAKPPERFNYVTQEDRRALSDMIENLFEQSFKSEVLDDIQMGVKQTTCLMAWIKRNGVHIECMDTLQMKIDRMLMSYRKKGVELNPAKKIFKKYEKKEDKRH